VLLILLALILLLGRYSGYRLTELFRFRALAREVAAGNSPPVPVATADNSGAPAVTVAHVDGQTNSPSDR